MKILIVDDDSTIRNWYRRKIEDNFGVSNTSFAMGTNGADGWERFLETQPDVVITDLRMEEPFAGLELARKIKGISKIPVVLITSICELMGDDIGNIEVDYILPKPPDEQVLIETIKKFLRKEAER